MRVSVNGDRPDTPELSDLERTVFDTALAGEGAETDILRRQLSEATVMSRTASGVGFVTRLRIPDELPGVSLSYVLPVVRGEHPQLPGGAEFILQLKNGRLHTIEAFCFEGMWPEDEAAFRFDTGD